MAKNTVTNCSLAPRHDGKILLVDDEKDIAIVLKRGLERYGFRVDAFDEPATALKSFRAGSYDLVITDVDMPNMNGFELYQEIRKTDAGIKICFLTAFEAYPEELKVMSPPEAKCFIKKPVTIGCLAEIVKDELEGSG